MLSHSFSPHIPDGHLALAYMIYCDSSTMIPAPPYMLYYDTSTIPASPYMLYYATSTIPASPYMLHYDRSTIPAPPCR